MHLPLPSSSSFSLSTNITGLSFWIKYQWLSTALGIMAVAFDYSFALLKIIIIIIRKTNECLAVMKQDADCQMSVEVWPWVLGDRTSQGPDWYQEGPPVSPERPDNAACLPGERTRRCRKPSNQGVLRGRGEQPRLQHTAGRTGPVHEGCGGVTC